MKNNYWITHLHSHFSLLDSIATPKHIFQRINELSMIGCSVTDHGNINGSIEFLKEAKKNNKKIGLGCELYVCKQHSTIKNESNRSLGHLLVVAKNNNGWVDLVKLISESNTPDKFYYKPRLSLEELKPYFNNRNLLVYGGHYGSVIANEIFDKDGQLINGGIENAEKLILELKDILQDDLYLESQLISPDFKSLVDIIRELSIKTNVKTIASIDSHFVWPRQRNDHWVALAANLRKTINECQSPQFGLSSFFKEDSCYYIPSYDELIKFGNTEQELQNTLEVASKIEEYTNILKNPQLPQIKCPENRTPYEQLKYLCEEGFKSKIENKVTNLEEYRTRLDYELGVIQNANLSSYFLIIEDIIHYIQSNGWVRSIGRGSAAGCLIAYLINITQVDPLTYGLMFQRFYDESRKNSPPDIDLDVQANKRDSIIAYIKSKYSEECVCQMVTFTSIKGRGALKAVLRAHNVVTPTEMNNITVNIPDEAKIAPELQIMKEEEGESSIIKWALENNQDKLKSWCYIDEEDQLQGPLAKYFEQAIRLEGTKVNQSKHAAGVIIAPEPLINLCPMIYDSKTNSQIAGFEMNDM